MDSTKKLLLQFSQPISSGISTALISTAVLGQTQNFAVGGVEIPGLVFRGVTSTLSNELTTALQLYALPMIPGNSLAYIEGSLISPVLNGLTNALIMQYGVGEQNAMVNNFIAGAAGSFVGEMVSKQIIGNQSPIQQ